MLLRRLLLLPLLAPLLAVLLVGALNPRPQVALQLLVWRSPALPLGAWLGLAAGGGGALSAGVTALALRGGGGPGPARRRRSVAEVFGRPRDPQGWPEQAPAASVGRRPWSSAEAAADGWAGPSRAATDPPPTVSVPFRVLRRGSGSGAAAGGPASGATAAARAATGGAAPRGSAAWGEPAAAPSPAARPGGTGDGWDDPASDDW